MFGRSGQMFPRRTFHDAIYEEEYGSDNEDECCRCRGLSAILCWFLSVIILVGLAATVVLTVFFILRSRTLMVKPDVDVDVELYGKDQNLYESKGGGGGSSKELVGSNEVATSNSSSIKRKKSNTKGSGRGPPDATKNDVDADVNEEQNAINDSSEQDEELAEDASVNHPRNQHPNHHTHQQHNRNRLQPYSPVKTTTTTSTTSTTTEAPTVPSEEEENNQNESSSEEETDTEQNNGEGSSLFNLFSGPRNPSYSTPSQNEDEEDEEEDAEDDGNNEDEEEDGNKEGAAGAEYSNKPTRYQDGAPVQQVLFTESPKVTLTTPSPFGGRRNLQTTRIATGRTSFTTTTTTAMPPSEESEEEEDEEKNNEEGNEEVDENEEKSSEEKQEASADVASSPQTTTSVYDDKEGAGSGESGENQLKQMLLDSIPPHGANKDDEEAGSGAKEDEEEETSDTEEMGGMSSSSEFNLSQKVQTTTALPSTSAKPVKTPKPTKTRGGGDTISRLISRNFTRKTTSTTPEASGSSETETQTERPAAQTSTMGPAGHKYDYTMTPNQRTKLKVKSAESVEQEVVVTSSTVKPKFTLKQRFRSTTVKPVVTPDPPSTAAPRTRGTTPPATSTEFGIKLGGKRGSVESPIDIVPSPDLSPKGQLKQQIQRLKEQQQKKQQQQQQNSFEGVDLNSASTEDQSKTSSEQQFIDVLVGADDTKTLVTKKTDDGIVTSAILPPWYDSKGVNGSIADVLATNGTTLSNAVAKVPVDPGENEAVVSGENSFGEKMTIVKKKSSEEKSPTAPSSKEQEGPSEFERLVNMFSKQEASSEEAPSPTPTNRFGFKKQKPIVLKKPGGSVNSRYIPQVPGRASLFPSTSTEAKSTENKSSGGPSPSGASPEADATTNLERPPGDVGRTGILPTAADVEDAVANSGYHPENGGDPNKVVEHQMMESERLNSEEMEDSHEDDDPGNPSHVIDVNIEEPGDNPQEIIIEQDTSAPMEDEEGDFVEDDDYGGYGENPPTLAMAGSTANENVVPPPEDYVLRGSGIRRPVSSEEGVGDMEGSASSPVENNATTTESPQTLSTLSTVAAIRRPAYTREEIAKAVVKPSPESLGGNNLNDGGVHEGPTGSVEEEFEDEYEDDDNYEGGSMEQHVDLEQWSSEKIGSATAQRWSAPDKMMDAVIGQEAVGAEAVQRPRPTLSEELTDPEEMNESAESIGHPAVQQNPANSLDTTAAGEQVENSTAVFRPPQLVSFHENKLSFSPPAQADGEYHSKDGWRPVISKNGGTSQEPGSAQVGSFEQEEHGAPEQMFLEPSPMQQLAHVAPVPAVQVQAPPPQQQWAQEQPPQSQQQWAQEQPPLAPQQMVLPPPPQHPLKHNSIIPPPVPAAVKFPDSEEDHEDRRHHGRRRIRPGQQGQFDRAKYMTRPVPPPIVMRRRPHSGGPFPPPPGHNTRQGPPPPHQRPPPPMMQQQAGSQPNPQFAEQPPQGRPPHPPINRNFHVRPNPMRRFNFGGGGGPPQAQPRSGGNIKWPTESAEVGRGDNDSQQQNLEGAQSEVSINKRRRRRRRVLPVLAA